MVYLASPLPALMITGLRDRVPKAVQVSMLFRSIKRFFMRLALRAGLSGRRRWYVFLLCCKDESRLKMPEITPVSPRETGVGLGGSFQSANSVHQQGFIWYAMHPEQGMPCSPPCARFIAAGREERVVGCSVAFSWFAWYGGCPPPKTREITCRDPFHGYP